MKTNPVSRLTLGTVQFGIPYGVANSVGRPDYETARDILACAIEGGATSLDTAAAYGESERVLGRALADLRAAGRVVVTTKVAPLPDDLSSARADSLVEESVRNSLRNLGLECLPFCLFHHEKDFRHADSLLKLRERGLVGRVGCSVTTPRAARSLVASGRVEAIQFPASVLDRRFTGPDISGAASARGIAVFARSIYLQGLILLPEVAVPDELRAVVPVRRNLEELARGAGISVAELAIRYTFGLGDLTSVLVGVESVDQMRENLCLHEKGPLPADLMRAVASAVPSLPDAVIDPWRWKQSANSREGTKARG